MTMNRIFRDLAKASLTEVDKFEHLDQEEQRIIGSQDMLDTLRIDLECPPVTKPDPLLTINDRLAAVAHGMRLWKKE